ncbi:MAG TPA: 30S ribosomal protein S3 [Anaerolineales bacterium]|nr:30S ribosomal protein S3 [Anaerolineae bacterium]HIQ01761.1 30S ribosomal protein S3 [Anaerolineales bacterium]
MGRKVHPYGFRLKVIRDWQARWYAEGQEYSDLLHEDLEIRDLIERELVNAGVSRVEIERFPNQVQVIIWTARPGIVIGRKGVAVKALRRDLEKMTGKKVHVDVQEIERPELDARLVAQNVVAQLERRISHGRAMKRALQQAMRAGAQGIKVMCKGRLGGAEMARAVWMREGRVPLQTLRADIDYAQEEAYTTYGRIGVKVWIYKGEVLPETKEEEPFIV